MEANHASDAVVAVVRMYTGLLGAKSDEITELTGAQAELKGNVAEASGLFTRLKRALEKHTEGLLIESPQQVTEIAIAVIEQGSQTVAMTGRLSAALRETLTAVGATRKGVEPPTDRSTLFELVGRVCAALVDLRAETQREAGDRGRVRSNVVGAAIVWAQAPRSKKNIAELIAAIDQHALYELDEVKVRQLHRREGEVLKAARAYGREGTAPGVLGDLVAAARALNAPGAME